MPTVTSPHSGHFMTSNLDDDDDTVDGLGRGLGIEGPDPSTAGIVFGHDSNPKGYNFEDACKKPRDTYRFISANNKHYVKDFDNSLSKLFACMTLAYSGQLSTPKFKAFKGMKINVWDKMRLNNIIWREWHLQFVKKHKPLVCSFTVHMDVHTKPQSVVLEGKYWKRKLDIVCVEYQKWRIFYKKKIMPKNTARLGIEQLLERVAGREAHELYRSQSRDPLLPIDDDQFPMDISDTLFSTLSQGNHGAGSSKDDYYGGFVNPDFIQPHLIGLQPSLDDFGNCDSMEPIQDLLNEAFGWNTSSQSQTQGNSPFLTAEPVQQNPPTYYSPTFGAQQHSSPFNQQTLYVPSDDSITSPGSAPRNKQFLSSAPVSSTLPSTTAVTPLNYVTVVQSSAIRQQPQGGLWQHSVPLQPLASSTKASGPRSNVHKGSPQKPVPIAPKSVKPQNTAASPFLAQLLTSPLGSSHRALIASLHKSGPAGSNNSSTKTIVPDLVAVSGTSSSTAATGAAASKASLTLSPTLSSGDMSETDLATATLPASNEVFHSVSGAEGRTEPHHSQFSSSTAEQKRRTHIKNGFEAIQTLVPALANNPSNKVSKATMLLKTAEFAQKLKMERQQMQNEADLLQQEIDALNCAIGSCQSQLPATGVPLASQHNTQMKQILESYIAERTHQNWKFYIFSQLASPLFDSFNTMVSTASVDELYRTTQTWLDQHCTLPALRPAILNSLRTIGTDTSILSDPSSLPDQARAAVQRSSCRSDSTQPDSFTSQADFLPS